jgi:hypothetical protein
MRAVMADSVSTGICMLIGLEPSTPAPARSARPPEQNSARAVMPAVALLLRMLLPASICFCLHIVTLSLLLLSTQGLPLTQGISGSERIPPRSFLLFLSFFCPPIFGVAHKKGVPRRRCKVGSV